MRLWKIIQSISFTVLAATSAATVQSTKIPIQIEENLVLVHTRIGHSKLLWFALDSGASWTVIDSSVARHAGLSTFGGASIHGAGSGTVKTAWGKNVVLQIGPLQFVSAQPAIIDLSGTSKMPHHTIAGLLGYDFLSSHVVTVDYEHLTLTVDPDAASYEPGATKIPITFQKRWPMIHVLVKPVGGKATDQVVLIDSGSSDSLDSDLMSNSLGVTKTVTGGKGLGNTFKIVVGRWSSIQLGAFTLPNATGGTGANLVGGQVLHRFTVTFDYPSRLVWLKPNKYVGSPYPTPQ